MTEKRPTTTTPAATSTTRGSATKSKERASQGKDKSAHDHGKKPHSQAARAKATATPSVDSSNAPKAPVESPPRRYTREEVKSKVTENYFDPINRSVGDYMG